MPSRLPRSRRSRRLRRLRRSRRRRRRRRHLRHRRRLPRSHRRHRLVWLATQWGESSLVSIWVCVKVRGVQFKDSKKHAKNPCI